MESNSERVSGEPLDILLPAMACPACHGGLAADGAGVSCRECRARYPRAGGFVDFAPHIRSQAGLTQKFMESPLITAIYEDYFRPLLTRTFTGVTYAEEERYLEKWFRPASGPILDLACGSGRYARILARQAVPEHVVGLDLSGSMLAKADEMAQQGGIESILWVRGSALGLPFPDASLGGVTCFGALHLFPDPGRALAEIGRTLKPGGSFACLAAARVGSGLWRRLQPLVSRMIFMRFFEPAKLAGMMDAVGLEVLDLSPRRSLVLLAARKR